jgi:hypothetical protein
MEKIMAKPIKQRIADSFDDDAAAKDYSDKVYAAWSDLSSALRRNAVLIFLLVAAFELLIYQKTSSIITFASFSLANSSFVQIALPTVIAFLVYEGWRLGKRWADLGEAYYALIKRIAPKASENDLDLLIRPMPPTFWAFGMADLPSEVTQRSEIFMANLTLVFTITFAILFPLAFEGQAYYLLFQKFGYHDAFLWINVSLTVALLVCTIIYTVIYVGEDH